MRRAALALLAATSCGDALPLPARDLAVTITAGDDVEFGRAFPLTIEREWSVDLTPETWRDDVLAPLRLVVLETRRRSDGRRVLETRRCRAYAFVAGRVELPAVPFHATDRAGATQSVASAPLLLDVRSSLADPASAAELPDELLLPRSPFTKTGIALAAALLLLLLAAVRLVARRRRLTRVPPPAPAPPARADPRKRALVELARLRASDPQDEPSQQEFHVAAATLLKEYVAAAFTLPALERTTEEIAAGASDRFDAATLARLLARCDRVKFARATSEAATRTEWLDGAVRFVERSP